MFHEFVTKMPPKIAVTNSIAKLVCWESPYCCQRDIQLLLVIGWQRNSASVGEYSSS